MSNPADYPDPGFGYHVDNTTGIATGNDPESIYAVMSGTHFNDGCCFDVSLFVCCCVPSRSSGLSPAFVCACLSAK